MWKNRHHSTGILFLYGCSNSYPNLLLILVLLFYHWSRRDQCNKSLLMLVGCGQVRISNLPLLTVHALSFFSYPVTLRGCGHQYYAAHVHARAHVPSWSTSHTVGSSNKSSWISNILKSQDGRRCTADDQKQIKHDSSEEGKSKDTPLKTTELEGNDDTACLICQLLAALEKHKKQGEHCKSEEISSLLYLGSAWLTSSTLAGVKTTRWPGSMQLTVTSTYMVVADMNH